VLQVSAPESVFGDNTLVDAEGSGSLLAKAKQKVTKGAVRLRHFEKDKVCLVCCVYVCCVYVCCVYVCCVLCVVCCMCMNGVCVFG